MTRRGAFNSTAGFFLDERVVGRLVKLRPFDLFQAVPMPTDTALVIAAFSVSWLGLVR